MLYDFVVNRVQNFEPGHGKSCFAEEFSCRSLIKIKI